jgi:hypothetical protein
LIAEGDERPQDDTWTSAIHVGKRTRE